MWHICAYGDPRKTLDVSLSFCLTVFRLGLSLNLRLTVLARLGWLAGKPLRSTWLSPQTLGCRHTHPCPASFTWILGIQTRVLMFHSKGSYSLSCLSSPNFPTLQKRE